MTASVVATDDVYILNHCTKYLARDDSGPRHVYGGVEPGDPRAAIAEAWRFPVVDSHGDPADPESATGFNDVTFVHAAPAGSLPANVTVVGTFAPLYQPIPLRRVSDTPYYAVTLQIPRGEAHSYRFVVDGVQQLDAVNPQRATLDNGREWSRFFTQGCSVPLVFERWERQILQRLVEHILPFRSKASQNFLARYYDGLDRQARRREHPHAHRHDRSVGVVNFIDKLLAREESHHRLDYQICLELIDEVLRGRNPYIEPERMSREMYEEIYDEMAANDVVGWDRSRYGDASYFLKLLRRHTATGAFAHPKYGGNAGASGWAWLADTFRDPQGQPVFAWEKAIEPPLGTSPSYRG